MLNPFPDLLVFGLLAPTIIRVTLGLLLLQSALLHLKPKTRKRIGTELSSLKLNVLGSNAVWGYIAFEAIVGAMLVIGLYTQIAALLGIAASAKLLYLSKCLPSLSGESRAYHALAIAAYVSLMLSGAGAFSVDLPL